MFRPANPAEVYRRVELDAHVAGSDRRELVRLCLRDVEAALTQALWADRHDRPDIRRRALARAQNGIGALRLGVDPASELGPTLLTFYASLGRSLVANQLQFDAADVARVRGDIGDIARAMFA